MATRSHYDYIGYGDGYSHGVICVGNKKVVYYEKNVIKHLMHFLIILFCIKIYSDGYTHKYV